MNYIVASNRPWVHKSWPDWQREFPGNWYLISDPGELTVDNLTEIGPRYLFFPHWSCIIKQEIYEGFECVMFHMTDLPFGRGGSPLQNLLSRGIYETQMTAFRCTGVVDGGPVYMKRPFSLDGTAGEIYVRATGLVGAMIKEIVATNPEPVEQQGQPVVFPRRTPEDGDISGLVNPVQIYDYIRMLDAEGYPPAFLETGRLRLEFRRAVHDGDAVRADVIIKRVK